MLNIFKFSYLLAFLICTLIFSGCTNENEVFCSRYISLYKELQGGDVPGYWEMRDALNERLADPNANHEEARFMMFVLDDFFHKPKIKDESPKDYCMRRELWLKYG